MADKPKPLAVRCSECMAKLRVPATLAGRKGKCPHCDSKFIVPTAEMVAAALPDRFPLEIIQRATTIKLEDFIAASGGRSPAPHDTININDTGSLADFLEEGSNLDDLLGDLEVRYGK